MSTGAGNVVLSMSRRDAEFVLRAVLMLVRLSSFESDKQRGQRLIDQLDSWVPDAE